MMRMKGALVGLVVLLAGCGSAADETSVTVRAQAPAAKETTSTTRQTTTTTAPTTTTTRATTTTAPAIGSQANPVPAGVPIPAGDWEIAVTSYEPDVTAFVLSLNQFNNPPAPGNVFSRVGVDATFTGTGLGSPYQLQMNLIGASKQTYQPASGVAGGSGGEPAEVSDAAQAPTGAKVVGYIYYELTAADAAGPLLAFPPNVKYTDVPGGVGFFRVQ